MRIAPTASFLASFLVLALCLATATAAAAEAPATPAPAAVDPASRALFDKKCAMCHGEDGKAQTKMGQKHKLPSYVDAEWQAKQTDEKLKDAITNGVGTTQMKGWKGKLTPAEIDGLVRYVRSFNPAK